MKALLLAGGLGTRLLPLTEKYPKCLMEIGGEPLLGNWIRKLVHAGVSEIYINIHHHRNLVKDYAERSEFSSFIRLIEEPELQGTAGTLKKNASAFIDETFLLVHADNFCLADLRKFIDAHINRPNGVEITMMTFVTETPESCGIVKYDENGILREFHEKVQNPPGNIANGAVFVLEPSVLHFMCASSLEFVDFSKDVSPLFLGRAMIWMNESYHRDIGTLLDYKKAQDYWASKLKEQWN